MSQFSKHEGIFLFKPAMYAGEHITGYVTRVSVFAARAGVAMTQKLQNKSGYRLAWLFPSGLEQLSQLYGSPMPAAETLLMDHTLFPLFQPFLSPEDAGSLRAHLLIKPMRGISSVCGLTGDGPSSRLRLAMCKSCVAEDGEIGIPYWRVAHMFPGLALCPFHLESLYTFCGKCISGFRGSRTVWVPSSSCVCGAELAPVRILETPKERAVEEGISRMFHQILVERQMSSIDQNTVLATISRQARKLGFDSAGGLCKIVSLLEQHIGAEALSAYRLTASRRSIFHMCMKGVRLSRNPIHSIILIQTLFGDMKSFLDSARQKITHLDSTSSAKTNRWQKRRALQPDRYFYLYSKSAEEIKQMRERFRKQLLMLKKQKPCLKRRELNKTGMRHGYVFLLRFDAYWLDQVLPSRRFARDNVAFNAQKRDETDCSMALHVRARYDQLVSARLPSRITHTRLMQGHSFEGIPKKKFLRYPETVDALEVCIESIDAWRARETRLLIEDVMSVAPNWPFGAVLDPDNLTPGKRDYLNRKIRKWLSKKAST